MRERERKRESERREREESERENIRDDRGRTADSKRPEGERRERAKRERVGKKIAREEGEERGKGVILGEVFGFANGTKEGEVGCRCVIAFASLWEEGEERGGVRGERERNREEKGKRRE